MELMKFVCWGLILDSLLGVKGGCLILIEVLCGKCELKLGSHDWVFGKKSECEGGFDVVVLSEVWISFDSEFWLFSLESEEIWWVWEFGNGGVLGMAMLEEVDMMWMEDCDLDLKV